MEIKEKELDQEEKLNQIISLFEGISLREWRIIEKHINIEFENMALDNWLTRDVSKNAFKNARKELELSFL
ncbi:hypothetical protein [Clostridium sp.]|uniref:hypothetical protein n=1 Tax=Clostridium sp. TaxID=1506 RepID=UPI0032173582